MVIAGHAGRWKLVFIIARSLDWTAWRLVPTQASLLEPLNKNRYYGQNSTFNNIKAKHSTLSTYCGTLKDKNVLFERNCFILAHAKAFNPVTKVCRLCLKEVYFIFYKPETSSLNKKTEIFGWCKHIKYWTLKKLLRIKFFFILV